MEPFAFSEVKRTKKPRRRRRRRPAGEDTGRAGEIIYRTLLTVMILAAVFFIVSVFFRVRTVEVTGTERYPEEYVSAISGIHIGDRLLFVNEFQVSQNLFRELPFVKSVKLRRRPPERVVIEITERVPVAKLVGGGVTYIIDEEGYLLDCTVLDDDYHLPLINGAVPAGNELGKPLEFTDPLMSDALGNILRELVRSDWMEKISLINLEKIYNISFTYDHRFQVVLGDATSIEYKLSLLKEVLERLHDTDQGIIDLSTFEMARFQPAIL